MNYRCLKTKISILLSIMIASSVAIPVKAVEQCHIGEERTFFSEPAININKTIKSAMKSADLEGKVERILWAEGFQIYEIENKEVKIFGPSAELFSVKDLGNKSYLFDNKEIGHHYKLNTPAWEYEGKRFIAKEIEKIEGAENKDAPWLKVKTNQEGYYILRIETRGGAAPDCQFEEGLVGVPYQTLYVIVYSASPQAIK